MYGSEICEDVMNINDGLRMLCDTSTCRLKRGRGQFQGAGRGRSYFKVLGRSHSVDRVVATAANGKER
jgi:hypothetical protein